MSEVLISKFIFDFRRVIRDDDAVIRLFECFVFQIPILFNEKTAEIEQNHTAISANFAIYLKWNEATKKKVQEFFIEIEITSMRRQQLTIEQ